MDAWKDMRVLSTRNETPARACKPFSANRDGFILSEGAGIVLLEDMELAVERGAHIYGEVAGYGATADAAHITFPDPEGEAHAIKRALRDAGATAAEIDYINAHGTATKLNDASETEALKAVFGSRAYEIPVSSIKSMLGHSMGASGAIEFIATVLSIERGLVPPTINYEERDPQCDLDYITEGARAVRIRAAISNSFGFGGNNAVLVARRYEG
jgi:3-oxoacyl-[acyl-carrier-protein] synthase II